MKCEIISQDLGKEFIKEHHYAPIAPPITKISFGLFWNEKLVGVALWGYGTRPKHTLNKMFPSLKITEYLELNRLCVLDSMPRNTESHFIRLQIQNIRSSLPTIKLLFSWADGLRGKPGYVYQSANWLYGGAIWSEFYITSDNEVVHPRLLITRLGTRSKQKTFELGLKKVRGYQFRYCRFLCSHAEKKRLLAESPMCWTQQYPKHRDLKFLIQAEEGSRESRQPPKLKRSVRFRHSALLRKTL